MKKRIKKKIKKLKKSINKINKVRVQKGRKAMLQETWATVTYGLYDNRKIRRLKKFPQEVPVPACWSEKTAEFPEPSEVEL